MEKLQPHQLIPPGAETLPFMYMMLTLCSYRFSSRHGWLMVLCPDNVSDSYFVDAKKFASGGYHHLFQARFGATAVCKERCPNAPFRSGIAAGAAQAPDWSLPSRQRRGG
jgi:hypothetical protein